MEINVKTTHVHGCMTCSPGGKVGNIETVGHLGHEFELLIVSHAYLLQE